MAFQMKIIIEKKNVLSISDTFFYNLPKNSVLCFKSNRIFIDEKVIPFVKCY